MSEREQELMEVISRVDGVTPGSGLKKHCKMASSPFVMLRGASSVFYQDLANLTFRLPEGIESWPLTMVMGDCHVSNFGFFSEEGSHGDNVIFAPNDFDDACIGHAGWDLLRYGVSLLLCADHCQGAIEGRYQLGEPIEKSKVICNSDSEQALTAFWQSYRATCQQLVEQEIDYQRVLQQFDDGHVLYKLEQKALKRQAGGEDFMSKSSLAKAVDLAIRPLAFLDLPEKFKAVDGATYRTIEKNFAPYVDDQILDIVERIGAGTGSVNMKRYYLLVGPEQVSQDELHLCHIVEVKKQRAAAPLFEYQDLSRINLLSPAHLTVNCQRRMQRNPDLVLDDVLWRKSHWLVRSRHHARVGIDPEDIACGKRALKGGFQAYATACGEALALAHARFDRRSKRFEAAVIKTPEETWQALETLQKEYAEQVMQDWQWLASVETPLTT
ncbi:hypothetical protein MAQ5080_02978 [Marinomonas aquimarina]|uniref:DUF2252 domain-containing protein n=1 Tax=Marinomonas aquimarina TaxID=295068 RepID=A0A1A8TM78_9GAMM|nr:DUF2252 family protein [Marinomonas aquimarina]SBS34800.1 hypothetical protein MAQ5080_02978 [Marinomonas aquimarina]